MAKEYIEREALIEALDDIMSNIAYSSPYQDDIPTMVCGIERARDCIEDAPTADVVEVVRCRDCWKSADGLCSYQLKNVPGKDFCGDGERRKSE